MNSIPKELFNQAVLGVVAANGRTRFGMSIPAVRTFVGAFGFIEPPESDVTAALEYLAQKGLVEEVVKRLNPGNRHWKITAEGLDFVDANP